LQNLSTDTIKNIGFDKIKTTILSFSRCGANQDYFKNLSPINNLKELDKQLSLSDIIYQGLIRENHVDICQIPDAAKILSKIKIKGTYLSEDEFKILYDILQTNYNLKSLLSDSKFNQWKTIQLVHTHKTWLERIQSKFEADFNIKKDASKNLIKLCKEKKNIDLNINSKIKQHYNNAKKKNWLQNENISWINERLVLPFKVSLKNKIEGIVHQHSSSGRTAFVEPIEIVNLNNIKSQNELDIHIEKRKILTELTQFFHKIYKKIESINNFVNKYDKHLTIAKYAKHINAVKPIIKNSHSIKIKNGINPFIKEKVKKPVPLNFEMNNETNIYIISGPNTGGKTVVLKSIGLYTIMAQSGIFIPADYFETSFFDSVLTDIGDKQSIESGLSTFSSHLTNINNILNISTNRSLVLLDEIGSGTDPNSSMALAQSILENFNKIESKLITTTHLLNLKEWASKTKYVKNGMMKFDKNNFTPTYEFISGIPGSSYALEISEKIGLSKKIINRSKSLIGADTTKLEKLITELQKREADIQITQQKIQEDLNEIEQEKIFLKTTKKELNKKIRESEYEQGLQADNYLKTIKRKVEKTIEEIKLNNASTESIKKAKKIIDIELKKTGNKIKQNIKKQKVNKKDIKIGEDFIINSLNLIGTVDSSLSNNKVFLNVDGKRIKIDYAELAYPSKTILKKNKKLHSKFNISNISSNNIDLRGCSVDEAIEKLDKYIDSAYMNNISYIKILHGTGTGALKEAIHNYLKLQKHIKNYSFAKPENGGYGVTEITII
tara:strand:+ start:3592 stop:5934 length:2343 start_codon:yes stop_codon:yes gene_type:complete